MEENLSIAVSKAAQNYEIPKPTLASWIKKEIIKATRAGDGERSPWMIDVASLEAHLKKCGKMTNADEGNKHPVSTESVEKSGKREMPSLRDHHITVPDQANQVTKAKPATASVAADNVAKTNRRSNRSKKPKRSPNGHKTPSTFPFRISTRQLKDAMYYMTLDETLQMRNWLNKQLDRKLNS